MSRATSAPGTGGPPSIERARSALFGLEIRHGAARRTGRRRVYLAADCRVDRASDHDSRLDWRPLMAVPKRKTSKARRDKRRATHSIEAPRVNTCPQCGSPKRAHRVCPTCGTYKGREVEPLRLQAP